MSLPKLTPGQRFNQTLPPETADALLLAQFAQREKGAGRLAAVVCADASHARRLLQELPFFLPGLRFPIGRRCPTTSSLPTRI